MKQKDGVMSSLPLDWTQVKRNVKRQSSRHDINNDKCNDPFCCIDTTEGNNTDGMTTKLLGNKRQRTNDSIDKSIHDITLLSSSHLSTGTMMEGKGIICMVEDSTWFQGYFVPLKKKKVEKPIGFLATTSLEKDGSNACCSCEEEDGYRIMDIQLFGVPSNRKNHQLTQQLTAKKTKQDKLQIICRGGDYLSFSSKSKTDQIITFQSQTIMTKQSSSEKFNSLMKQYFQSILCKANSSDLKNELLNSTTIVIGTMKIQIPTII